MTTLLALRTYIRKMSTGRSSRRPLRVRAPGSLPIENDALVARAWHLIQEERAELVHLLEDRSRSRAARNAARLEWMTASSSSTISTHEMQELQDRLVMLSSNYQVEKRLVRRKRAYIAQLQAAYEVEFQQQFGFPPN